MCEYAFGFLIFVPILTNMSQYVMIRIVKNEKESAYHEEKKCDKLNKVLCRKE